MLEFLFNGLTDPRVTAKQPPFDRPTLRSEVNGFEANEYGTGTPHSGSTSVPEIIANSPAVVPRAGAGSWVKLGVGRVKSGAPPTSDLIGVPLHFQWPVGGSLGIAYSDAATLVPFQ